MSVVVPTRNRAAYLEVALQSIQSQDTGEPYELIVVDDASSDETPGVARRHGAQVVSQPSQLGLNAGRNAGIAAARAPLIAFVDDDIRAPASWLGALMEGARRHPEADAFGGPIRATLEGPAPRSCGREEPPITSLDLGPEDRQVERVWGANFAIRRSAWERIGPFSESAPVGGDEEEWLRALRAAGGRVQYLAGAGLEHRRSGDDARLRSLARSAYGRGRNLRSWDVRRGHAPGLARELRVLAGCLWHSARRACPQGLIAAAHSLGRIAEALRPR